MSDAASVPRLEAEDGDWGRTSTPDDPLARPMTSPSPPDGGSRPGGVGWDSPAVAGGNGAPTPFLGGEAVDATGDDPAGLTGSRTGPADSGAEELLSRAEAQAEHLGAHAEAVRAEADRLRAEAGVLRVAVQHAAETARARAESAATSQAAVERLHSTLLAEADAVRVELASIRAEVVSIREVLRAEIDAGVADVRRMRAEVQRLWPETEKLAAELRLLLAGTGPTRPADRGRPEATGSTQPAHRGAGGPSEAGHRNGWGGPGGLRHESTWGEDVERVRRWRAEGGDGPAEGDAGGAGRGGAGSLVERERAELLREIWDAVSGDVTSPAGRRPAVEPAAPAGDPLRPPWPPEESGGHGQVADDRPAPLGLADALFRDELASGDPERGRTAQPLIGSGGWQQPPPADPGATRAIDPDPRVPSPSSAPGRRRRRFRPE